MPTDNLTNYALEIDTLQNVPDTRIARLAKGINVSRWFSHQFSNDRYDKYLSNKSLQFIHDIGFKHIRLSINPSLLFQEDNPGVLNAAILPYIDKAIARMQAKDLGIIIDIHPRGQAGNNFQKRLLNDEAFANKFTQFWGAFAKHLSSTNPEYVFLETINEPGQFFGEDIRSLDRAQALRWEQVQSKILQAMRENAPQHTLIAKALGDGYKTLQQLTPVADKNVAYSFHFYSPFAFTHQGASWLGEPFASMKGLKYQSHSQPSPAALQSENSGASDPLTNYQNTWNSDKIDRAIHQVADWAQANQVRVIADEFGALRNNAPLSDRINWLHDVSNSLARYGIGKSLWSLEDPFGLTYIEERRKVFDTDAAAAMGLTFNPLSLPSPLFSPHPT